jgi:hypothetical protein
VFHCDRGGKFTTTEFTEYCVEHGVKRQLTAPYSLQKNNVVEHHNQIVVGMAHSPLKLKNLLEWLWGEFVATTAYLLNQSPTKSVIGKTPFEAWYEKKPSVQHLWMFGCVIHVKDTSPNLKKLEDQSRPMIFIGYELGSKAYKAYDPIARRVHMSHDCLFS